MKHHKTVKSKPLIEMSPGELEDCFDRTGMDLHRAMLQDAREGKGQGVVLVAALLLCPTAPLVRQVVVTLDYGDGDGTRYIDDFVAGVKRCGLLAPGEDLQRMIFQRIPLSALLCSYMPIGKVN
jgi:hypothetical protein